MPPPKTPKSIEDTKLFYNMTASKQGWKINDKDDELIEMLAEGLTTNFNRYGYFMCPCRDSEGSREKDKDLICPCAYSHPDVEEYGHCFCGLYCDPTFLENGGIPKAIPERRPS